MPYVSINEVPASLRPPFKSLKTSRTTSPVYRDAIPIPCVCPILIPQLQANSKGACGCVCRPGTTALGTSGISK
jgi:hypothetical protein